MAGIACFSISLFLNPAVSYSVVINLSFIFHMCTRRSFDIQGFGDIFCRDKLSTLLKLVYFMLLLHLQICVFTLNGKA